MHLFMMDIWAGKTILHSQHIVLLQQPLQPLQVQTCNKPSTFFFFFLVFFPTTCRCWKHFFSPSFSLSRRSIPWLPEWFSLIEGALPSCARVLPSRAPVPCSWPARSCPFVVYLLCRPCFCSLYHGINKFFFI